MRIYEGEVKILRQKELPSNQIEKHWNKGTKFIAKVMLESGGTINALYEPNLGKTDSLRFVFPKEKWIPALVTFHSGYFWLNPEAKYFPNSVKWSVVTPKWNYKGFFKLYEKDYAYAAKFDLLRKRVVWK